MGTIRKSNFECLRLFAMFCIVLYHCYLLFVYDESSLIIHKAIQMSAQEFYDSFTMLVVAMPDVSLCPIAIGLWGYVEQNADFRQ